MEKQKIIEQIISMLQNASATQCAIALAFIQHLLTAVNRRR